MTGNPADFATLLVAIATAVVAVLDIFGSFVPTEVFIGCGAFLVAAVAFSSIVNQSRYRAVADKIDDVSAVMKRFAPTDPVREITPSLIGEELRAALGDARQWTFRGGSARWQRSAVLPHFGQITDRSIRYDGQIINPFDEALCQRYADYRSVQRTAGIKAVNESDGRKIQIDLMSFLFALAWYGKNARLLPSITLLNTYSPLRIDASEKVAIVTVADPGAPGLSAASDSWYYKSLLDEYGQASEMLVELRLPKNSLNRKRDGAAVKKFLLELVKSNPSLVAPEFAEAFTEDECEQVAEYAFMELRA